MMSPYERLSVRLSGQALEEVEVGLDKNLGGAQEAFFSWWELVDSSSRHLYLS